MGTDLVPLEISFLRVMVGFSNLNKCFTSSAASSLGLLAAQDFFSSWDLAVSCNLNPITGKVVQLHHFPVRLVFQNTEWSSKDYYSWSFSLNTQGRITLHHNKAQPQEHFWNEKGSRVFWKNMHELNSGAYPSWTSSAQKHTVQFPETRYPKLFCNFVKNSLTEFLADISTEAYRLNRFVKGCH